MSQIILLSVLGLSLLVVYSLITNYGTDSATAQSDTDYTPFDKVFLRIYSPDSNEDHNQIDTIEVLVTSSFSHKEFLMSETGLNTSVFEEEIRLSPNLSKFPGDVQTRRDDGVSATFRIDSDTVVTQSIYVNYHVGSARFDKPSYSFGDEAKIIINDRDMNRHPDTVDTLTARIWSGADRGGLFITLRETGASTGLFEEFITFSLDDASSGTRLKVFDSDTVTLKYSDSTLPPPAALAADGVETVEIEEIFASSTFGESISTFQRVSVSDLALINSEGERISKIAKGDQILVQTELKNLQGRKQPFVYVLLVKDSHGITESISWIRAELSPLQQYKVAQSWIPSSSDLYQVEVFVWENLEQSLALSSVSTISIEVQW